MLLDLFFRAGGVALSLLCTRLSVNVDVGEMLLDFGFCVLSDIARILSLVCLLVLT